MHQQFFYPHISKSKAFIAHPSILWAHAKRATSDVRFHFVRPHVEQLWVKAVQR